MHNPTTEGLTMKTKALKRRVNARSDVSQISSLGKRVLQCRIDQTDQALAPPVKLVGACSGE